MRKKFDADLIQRKADFLREQQKLADIIDAADEGSGHETADTGNATLTREMQLTMVERAEEKIYETEEALERLDNKVYGLCTECGKSIGKFRLQEAYPYAKMCVTCKEAYDAEY
jgi:RNA polymerase-binding transcription factor DksA